VDLGEVNDLNLLPPFDADAARALYADLIQPAEGIGLLAGVRHLIYVPDGPLENVPLHLAIDNNGHWLFETYAVTLEPSVGAAVLAHSTKPSGAPNAFLGIGDPVFAGYADPRRMKLRGLSPELRRELARLPTLPDTEREVRRMAAIFGESSSRLLLHENATIA